MRTLLVLLFLASPARAGSKLAMFGLGSATAEQRTGWVARAEFRADFEDVATGEDAHPIIGGRFGFERWDTGTHAGFAVPIGVYAGAQIGALRTTLGAGAGLWTFETTQTQYAGGISPFANATLEGSFGKLHASLDGRVSRQVIGDTDDFNVYSVILMLGRRWR